MKYWHVERTYVGPSGPYSQATFVKAEDCACAEALTTRMFVDLQDFFQIHDPWEQTIVEMENPNEFQL